MPRTSIFVLLLALPGLGCATAGGDDPSTVSTPSEGATAELRVVFPDLSGDGSVVCALWSDAGAFDSGRAPRLGAEIPVVDGRAEWVVDAPRGDLALKAFHDLDGDGELARGGFGQPLEPYGFSNDARGAFGPPSWEAARVEHGPEGSVLTIRLGGP